MMIIPGDLKGSCTQQTMGRVLHVIHAWLWNTLLPRPGRKAVLLSGIAETCLQSQLTWTESSSSWVVSDFPNTVFN